MYGFGLMPQALFTGHMGQSQRTLQSRLWQRVAGEAISPDGAARGFLFYDDFVNFYPVTVTTAAGQLQPGNGYYAYIAAETTVGSFKPVADKSGGVVKITTPTAGAAGDNDDITLTAQGNVGTLGAISDTAGSDYVTAFDCRFQLPSVTDSDGSFFIGLTEEGLAAADTPLVDSGGHTLASKDLIGFWVLESDNDALVFGYRKAGQALQTVLTYGTSLSANTWYQAGFLHDPSAPASKKIKVYINNVEQSTYVTATDIAAATFPDGEELTLTMSMKNSADNDPQSALVDSWAFFQGY